MGKKPINLERYIEKSPIVMFIWSNDPMKPVQYVSKNIKIFGYTQDEFVSNEMTYAKFVYPGDLARTRAETKNFLAKNIHNFSQHYRVITKLGEIRYVEDQTWGEVDSSGNYLYHCGTIIDQTKEREMEHHLQLRQRMDYLGNLAGGLIHNFNNILAIILGNLSLFKMNSSNLTPDQLQILNDATKASYRASDVIKELQNFTRGEDSSVEIIDLFKIVSEIIQFLKSTSNVMIKKINNIPPNTYFIKAAQSELNQVFLNLIINSLDAIEEKGVNPNDFISISTSIVMDDYIHIQIKDTGCGIPSENLDKIFLPFFTTKEKKKDVKGGEGLGLAMVYNIITVRYHGEISVDSVVGKGTTFHIFLPRIPLEEIMKFQQNNNQDNKNKIY
ncbi:MAG: ATP-binding protein [Promethearchaeota archaeon]